MAAVRFATIAKVFPPKTEGPVGPVGVYPPPTGRIEWIRGHAWLPSRRARGGSPWALYRLEGTGIEKGEP